MGHWFCIGLNQLDSGYSHTHLLHEELTTPSKAKASQEGLEESEEDNQSDSEDSSTSESG